MAKKVVRIHFMDDTVRGFAIDESATTEQLKQTVIERIGMKEDSCFAIFERKEGWERCMEPDEKPCEIMATWEGDKGEKAAKEGTCCFLFKKKIFLREDEREMKDPVAKHHVYIQALHSVIESEYPSTFEDAIKLAGLQMQIVYGDHKSSTHIVGFLTQNLKNYVPKDLFVTKKGNEWESLILKEHSKHLGKSEDVAKSEYLDIVKQWPFYGTTFYPPCKSIGSKKIPAKVIIGVNAEGILLLKKDKQELVSTHPFTEICSWASSSTTFAFEFGSQTESQKYTFETKQGAIIAACIQTYIDILVQMLKSGEDEEDE